MTSRLDYCNALLGGCPASSINNIQIVQNAAARVHTRSSKYDHITPILQSLHWLPIRFRISYKILLLTSKALNNLAPAYQTNLLSRYNPTRSLRSQNSGLLVVPRIAKSTNGGRTSFHIWLPNWNSLPDNVRGSDTLSLFKSRLKTQLFSQAFTFMHLTDAFIQSDLQYIQAIHLYCQYVCSLGIEPTTFALLMQCSNHWATGKMGWTNNFCLGGTTATLIVSLFVSLFLINIPWKLGVKQASVWIQPLMIWDDLRRDDANPSDNIQN